MLGSWFVQDGVLVNTQGQSPSLKDAITGMGLSSAKMCWSGL